MNKMNTKKTIALAAMLTGAAILSACTVPEPVVTGFNGDSVNIRINTYMQVVTDEAMVQVMAKANAQANDVCRRGHRKRAEYVSRQSYLESEYNYGTEFLYLCLN